ncbi:MAG: hypothetical protein R6V58_14100 [Planctomycetota bacterium]
MSEDQGPANLQEAVERSYRVQWGGRRYCTIAAVVLIVLSVLSGFMLTVASRWFVFGTTVLKIVEFSAMTTSFICLIAAVLFALEAVIRAQRERGELPDRTIHFGLTLSVITLAGLLFLLFMVVMPWSRDGIGESQAKIIRFILFLFCAVAWLGAVVMCSAGITMLVTRHNSLVEVNNTSEGTNLLFKRGYSSEILKLSIASLIPLIVFVVALLMVGVDILIGS